MYCLNITSKKYEYSRPATTKKSWGFIKGKFQFQLHRKKGPALIEEDIRGVFVEWYINGVEYFRREDYLVLSNFRSDCPEIIWDNGTKEWRKKQIITPCFGFLHRHIEPAIIYSNGDVEYWVNGERHRENGPAVIYGNKQYFFEYGNFIKKETIKEV
ncbi:MAG: hypothetical protein EKK64_06660 [Neisseriaceae bacterium]|nr:MAG: hypothetical protein EKK64_06660 [Neisseriaceae bacterium]